MSRSVWLPTAALCLAAGLLAILAPISDSSTDPDRRLYAENADGVWSAERFMRPPPTEHWLGDGAEKDNKKRRKAWIEESHQTREDTDWRAIERANGLAQIEKRNAIARARKRGAPPPASPGTDGDGTTEAIWVERGSQNQAGRMMVARLSRDGETLYGGSSKGGVWKGTPDGEDWETIGDNLYGGAHWLELFPPADDGDPNIVVAGTDNGLLHRSDDDGETWVEPEGLANPWYIRRMLVTTDDTEALFVVVSNDDGHVLLRSSDTGESFEQVADLGSFYGDVWTPRDGSSGLWMVDESGFHTSDDLGDTWTTVSELPTKAGQGELAGSEAGGPTFYLVLDSAALYRSDDAGESWSEVHTPEDYWSSLNASITDPDLFSYGGVNLKRTTDGGENFAYVNEWWEYYEDPATLLHADMMGVDVVLDADGNEIWYINTDGGLYRSTDGLETVENLSLDGLRVSQYYSTLTSSEEADHIAAGAQDQGYQITNTMTQDAEIKDFEQVISGDYGQLTSSDGSHNFVYSVYPGFTLIQAGEDNPWLSYANWPAGESYVPWMPPIKADPLDSTAYFFPATRLYRYVWNGQWDWNGSLYSKQDFARDGGEYISALVFSPIDPSRVYVATSSGRFWTSDDAGITWTESANMVADENWLYGQAIVASNTDIDTVYVGGSGYDTPGIYRSTDGGQTFEPFFDGMEDTFVYCLGEAPDGSGILVAGTESTVYRRDPDDKEWWDVTGGDAPVTTYWSVEALAHENTMRFGTYGRGIWDYQLDPDGTGCFPDVQDYDGDGVLCDEDCDDHDATISPDVEEDCDNGVDDNCDGAIDDEDVECGGSGGADSGQEGGEDSGIGGGTEGAGEDDGAATSEGEDKIGGSGCACSATDGSMPWLAVFTLSGMAWMRRRERAPR